VPNDLFLLTDVLSEKFVMKIKRENHLNCFLIFCLAAFSLSCGGEKSEATDLSATLSATDLAGEFKADEKRAHNRYAGERVRVSGKVSSVIAAPDGTFALTFRTSIYSFTPTRCYFKVANSEGLSSIKSNEEITIVGTVIGFDDTKNIVVLENCRLP
jgi:hypothetical protein